MTSISTITLEVPDRSDAEAFYTQAFGVNERLAFRPAESATSGFRSYTLSLVVSQPAGVDALVGAALEAGARALKPVRKSLWGYGGVVQAPDGAIWKVATSSKKNSAPASREIDDIVLLIGASDVAASRQFYTAQGLSVAKSFGRKYVQFDAEAGRIKLALYGHRALAKDAGVPPEGSGSHRIIVDSDAGSFVDPDGFVWNQGN